MAIGDGLTISRTCWKSEVWEDENGGVWELAITALDPHPAKKKILVDLRFLATFEVMTLLTRDYGAYSASLVQNRALGTISKIFAPETNFFRRQAFSWESGERKIS